MDAVEFLDKVDRLSKRGSTEEKMCYNDYRTERDNTRAVKFVEQGLSGYPPAKWIEHCVGIAPQG